MAEYVVSWLEEKPQFNREYRVFNSEDSIKNREEALKLYNTKKKDKYIKSAIFSKIIESHLNK